ncbi:MAG: retroviral-like aspartic protease family protein [Bacteroidales bacterium]|nr:retroviral-like aspartic protease family protein [Candidatus Sodaliphilus aphodohippi]
MVKKFLLLGLTTLVVLCSCGDDKKKKPVFEDEAGSSEVVENETDNFDSVPTLPSYQEMEGNIVSVPYREENGIKMVPVSINGFGFEMIFDTGCSGTLISVAEARYLYEKGYLTENDFIGMAKSQIADGSIVEDMVINLKEVVIGGQIVCKDVSATVSSNSNAPLLLGNEIIDRAAAFSIDTENKTINFKLRY